MQRHTYFRESIFCLIPLVKRQKSTSPRTCTLACRHYPLNTRHSMQYGLLCTPQPSSKMTIGSQRTGKDTASHRPSLLETDSKEETESLIYPSLADSERQRPWRLNSLSGTPALAAAVAPPDLKLCTPNNLESKPRLESLARRSSRVRV